MEKEPTMTITQSEHRLKEVVLILAWGVVANIITFYLIKKHIVK